MNWIDYVQTDGYLSMVKYVRSDKKDDKRILILADHIQDGGFDHYAEQIRELHAYPEYYAKGIDKRNEHERINRFLMREYILQIVPNIEGSCTIKNGFAENIFPDFNAFMARSNINKWSVWEAIRYTQPFAKCIIDPMVCVFHAGYARDLINMQEAAIFLDSFTSGRIISPMTTALANSRFDPVRVVNDTLNIYLDNLYGIE